MSYLNLKVPEDTKEISKILTEVRLLIKNVILEELMRHEDEIKKLRKATWPVCQCIKENSQITDISSKIEFLNELNYQEIQELLKEKTKFAKKGKITNTTSNLTEEEFQRLGL